MENVRFLLEGEKVVLEVKGERGAGIRKGEEVVEGKPVEGRFVLTVEEFMDLLFGLYGIEERVVLNLDAKRIEVGRSKDRFLKLTNFASQERSIFYLSGENLARVLLKAEVVRCSLGEVRFFHEGVFVRWDKRWNTLSFVREDESEELYGVSLFTFKEVLRDGMRYELGFMSFGAGKLSVVKPSGRIVIGGRWKDRSSTTSFLLAPSREIPKLTAKVFVATR